MGWYTSGMKTKSLLLALVCLAGWSVNVSSGQQPDALDEALDLVGMKRADLGWQPKGWWARFPAHIPYKLRSFDSLFAEPLDTVPFTRALARAAQEHLDPATLNDKLARGGHLYNAVHSLGVDPKFGGIRGYAANLTAEPTPLDQAILTLMRAADRPTSFVTFDSASPYPKLQDDLAEAVAAIPEDAQPILGRLVLNIVDAHRWAELAFRNVDHGKRSVVARRFNIGQEQVDALDYCPEFDDVAQTWDEASLWYAGGKLVQAVDEARVALAGLTDVQPFAFDWETPWGWIRIRGNGADQVDGTDALLIVDLGGDDGYTGPVAASTADRPIGILLDCGGNDRYRATGPAQGAGMCGIGLLVDTAGDDVYEAQRYAQGVGQFGMGVCADLGGNDTYFTAYSGQGCGYFGIGLMLDCHGNDSYKLYADGQGLGGVAGVGVLADRNGDDTYEAVRDAKITGRPSYHSPDEDITVSNAQGCAMGRRGDGADGHSWAGGLGALLDSAGNDRYTSGSWTMGTGYWFGTGILHDGGGDDEYSGVCYSQATGAHFAIGVLIDEGGNDRHLAEATGNMCIGWGHDFVISLLLNVDGDDTYTVKENGISYSINRSFTAVIDTGGNDTYTGKPDNRPGMAMPDARFRFDDTGVGTYFADATSLALFLDVGGQDTYWTGQSNNTHWLDDPDSTNWPDRNFSAGIDRPDGQVSFLPRCSGGPQVGQVDELP